MTLSGGVGANDCVIVRCYSELIRAAAKLFFGTNERGGMKSIAAYIHVVARVSESASSARWYVGVLRRRIRAMASRLRKGGGRGQGAP